MVSIDLLLGPECDLLQDDVFRTLRGWLESGIIWGVFSGSPCEKWSQARRAPPRSVMHRRLRTKDHLRGLPGLEGADYQAVLDSNKLADRIATLLRIALLRQLPTGEENPASSLLWLLPSRRRFCAHQSVNTIVFDYCGAGRPFRARTRMALANIAVPPELYAWQCKGRGICTFSGKPHVVLSGSSKAGFLTRLKAAYPPRLCYVLARELSRSYLSLRANRLWNLIR